MICGVRGSYNSGDLKMVFGRLVDSEFAFVLGYLSLESLFGC